MKIFPRTAGLRVIDHIQRLLRPLTIVLPRPILTIRPERHQHADSLAVTYNRGKRSCSYSIVKYSSRQKTLLDIGPP